MDIFSNYDKELMTLLVTISIFYDESYAKEKK